MRTRSMLLGLAIVLFAPAVAGAQESALRVGASESLSPRDKCLIAGALNVRLRLPRASRFTIEQIDGRKGQILDPRRLRGTYQVEFNALNADTSKCLMGGCRFGKGPRGKSPTVREVGGLQYRDLFGP